MTYAKDLIERLELARLSLPFVSNHGEVYAALFAEAKTAIAAQAREIERLVAESERLNVNK